MTNFLKYFPILIFTMGIFWACNSNQKKAEEIERPNDPWVFRSVLDNKPRMITLALNDDIWAAYSTEHGSLYQVWKGKVNFDGAVYTTLHGPQPLSVGDIYFTNQFENPWVLIQDSKEIKPEVAYKGHRFINSHVELMYQLSWNGKKVMVYERPEYVKTSDGLVGFERIFTTENVPNGTQIALMTNASSIASKNNIETDGNFQIKEEQALEAGNIAVVDLKGQLILNTNTSTFLKIQFVKEPTIKNPNDALLGENENEETPKGFNLIAKSDCKTCHNTTKKTIGPAYLEIAEKYANTEENIVQLTAKVKDGGYGAWGAQVMSAHPNDSEEDIREMVVYILSLDAKAEKMEQAVIDVAQTPEESDYVYAVENIVEDEMLPGAITRIYFHEKDLTKLADANTKQKPVYVDFLKRIHIMDADLGGMPDNFSIMIEGFLKIEKSGNYFFRLISDDGSIFSIGSKIVIDHDGLHGAEAKDGIVCFEGRISSV